MRLYIYNSDNTFWCKIFKVGMYIYMYNIQVLLKLPKTKGDCYYMEDKEFS